nr:hypothetical protein TetV2_00155 [Oceanusvirus sp.]
MKSFLVLLLLFFSPYALVDASSSGGDDDNRDPTSDGADDDDGKPRGNCQGRGDRHCYESWESKSCPGVCRRCERGKRMNSNMWSAIKDLDYDQVFTRSTVLCVARCKRGKRKCAKRVRYSGKRYCLAITCDKGQVEGCHDGRDFDEPSCEACAILFPRACKSSGDDDDDDGDDDSSSRRDDDSSSRDDDSSSEKSSSS